MSDLVSAIIPTYNCAKYVISAIESALAQTHKNLEIIVIDDGSTDNTSESLKKYIESGAIRYFYQKNSGVSAARNVGIQQSRGDFIAFLDSDDVWLKYKLHVQLEIFKRHPAIGCLGGDMLNIEDGYEYNHTEELKIEKIEYEKFLIRNRLNTPTVMVKKDILSKVGLFDEKLKYAEDREMWLRISRISNCYKVRLPLVKRRELKTGGLSLDTDAMKKCIKIILGKNFTSITFGPRKFYLFLKSYGYFYSDLSWTEFMNKRRFRAMKYLMLSFLIYPYPFSRDMVNTSMHRLKELYRYIFNKRPILD